MIERIFRRQGCATLILASICVSIFTACQPVESGGAPVSGTDQNGWPSLSLRVRHYDFPEANENAVLRDDLPDTILIRLRGIPGHFTGQPAEDHLFDTTLIGGAPFGIPWQGLLQSPVTQPLPYIHEANTVDSVTPAGVKIMRIGTFALRASEDYLFPDSVREGYGFYDTRLESWVMLMYFSGPATVHSNYALCDSTRFHSQLDIPAAGFYFLYQVRTGDVLELALLPDLDNLVFAVETSSQAFLDYARAESTRRWGCLAGYGQAKAGVWGSGIAGPPSMRDWGLFKR